MLYVSPLRAVTRDVELALKAPIEALGLPYTVETRTGDTKASVRARQKDRLPTVLITTPESLCLLLTREDAAEKLGSLAAVILDEWHELLTSKRGSQTELALARLRRFSPGLMTWAMSATIANMEEAAGSAGGVSSSGDAAPMRIVRGEMHRPIVIDTLFPADPDRLPWAGHLGLSMLPDVAGALDPSVPSILFTNTRSQAERWYHALCVVRPEWQGVMALHHGSLDREEREKVERGLKSGDVRIVVATSSLDLGVDFSHIERVFQIGSCKGIARLLQRAGRAAHRPNASARITCVPTHALELIEIAAARTAVMHGRIEPRRTPDKPLDVLAQHMVTCALGGGFEPDELYNEVRTAWSFRGLSRREFDWALALVREGGGTLAAYPEYHRVVPDATGRHRVVSPRIAMLHRLNVGTITADTTLEIRYLSGKGLGRIEENFVAHLREGERFVFAGKVLRFVMLQNLVAYVRPASGSTTHTPLWAGTRLPISESLAEEFRAALQRCGSGEPDCEELRAAGPLARIQRRESVIPAGDELLIEVCRTREGTHLFVFPFEGRLVHGGLAAVLALRLSRLHKATYAISANDYGFEIVTADDVPVEKLWSPELLSAENLAKDAIESMNMSQLARLQFREIARISGLVIQNYPGAHKSGKQLQASSSLVYDVLAEFDPEHLLLHQARREVLDRHFEHSRLARTVERIARCRHRLVVLRMPSPLSFPLLIERLAAKVSSETILERLKRMRAEWENPSERSRWTGQTEDTYTAEEREPTQRPKARRGRRGPAGWTS